MTTMVTMAPDAVQAVADAFVSARRARIALPEFPGAMPATEQEAYAIQQAAIDQFPEAPVGWKVGLVPQRFHGMVPGTRLFGPIQPAHVETAGDEPSIFRCIKGGFAAVEAEYILELSEDVPPQQGWTLEKAATTVGRVLTGVELAGSPYPEINDHGPLVTIADCGNNAGLILGVDIPGGLAGLEGATCSVTIDDVLIGEGGAASVPGSPVQSLVELLEHFGRRGFTAPAGTLVSTGAATGVHSIDIGSTSVADFGPFGQIRIVTVEG